MGRKNRKNRKKRNKQHNKDCRCNGCLGFFKKDNKKKKVEEKKWNHATTCLCLKCKKDNKNSSNNWNYKCHTGNVPIFSKDGVSVFGGGNIREARPALADIVIDLDNNVSSWNNYLPDTWESRRHTNGPERVLYLTIRDYGAPSVDKPFWDALWNDLKKQAPCNVLVMCQGGHGRTGLVLTCLIMAAKFDVGQDINPIIWLRDHYCENAVESQEQLVYVGDMWDIPYVKETKKTGYQKPAYSDYTTQYYKDKGYNVREDDEEDDEKVCHKGCGSEGGNVFFTESIGMWECDNCWETRTGLKLEENEDEANLCDAKCISDGMTEAHTPGCLARTAMDKERSKGGNSSDSHKGLHNLTDAEYSELDGNEMSEAEIYSELGIRF